MGSLNIRKPEIYEDDIKIKLPTMTNSWQAKYSLLNEMRMTT
jgi:hypothetical protein